MLYTPNYDIRWPTYCGPTAIAAVTGEPISVIRGVLRDIIGPNVNGHARPVRGLSAKNLLAGMQRLGWNVADRSGDTDNRENPMDIFRLGDFLDDCADGGPYIVNVTGHYYAVGYGEVCDTYLKIPIEVSRFKHGRKRWIRRWWRFAKV